jgi:hypothetical protein
MILDTFEKVTAELETALFSMEKSYVLGFCKDDVHYDDFGQDMPIVNAHCSIKDAVNTLRMMTGLSDC